MSKRHFASLSTQEALHVAIVVEARNANLYQAYAELFRSLPGSDTGEIASVFYEMAAEEVVHRSELQGRYAVRFGNMPCDLTEDEIRELIELPSLPDGSIFAIARTGATAMPATQVLAIALAAEESAFRFYRYLAETSVDPELAPLYGELAQFEAEHVEELREKMRMESTRLSANLQQA
jgi:rubrerythrin